MIICSQQTSSKRDANDNLNKKKELLKIFSAYTGKEYDGDYGDLFDGTEESTCSSPCLQTKVNSNGSR